MQQLLMRGGAVFSRLTTTATLGALALGCAFLYAFDPVTSGLYPLCPFRAVTGLNCPGCGTARAMHSLLRGHPADAFGFNPLAMLMLPIVLLLLVDTKTRKKAATMDPRLMWGLLAVVVAFGVLRNIPLQPFAALAP